MSWKGSKGSLLCEAKERGEMMKFFLLSVIDSEVVWSVIHMYWFTSPQRCWVSTWRAAMSSQTHTNKRALESMTQTQMLTHPHSPGSYGSNKTSGCHLLRSGQRRRSHCEHKINTQGVIWHLKIKSTAKNQFIRADLFLTKKKLKHLSFRV